MSFSNRVQLLIAATACGLALASAQVSFAQAQAPQPASTVPQAPAVAPGAQVAPQAQAPATAAAPFINPDPVQAAASAAANAVAAALQPQSLRPVLPTQAILLGTGYDGVVRPQGYEEAIRYYASLCSSSIDELRFARRNARIQARVFGRYAEAFNTLTTAIVRAANTMPPGFALQALLDADKLSKLVVAKLEQGPVGQDPAFPRDQIPIAAYHYVDQFLRFAITAHYEFDVPYWAPWMSCNFCADRSPWEIPDFRLRVAKFAREELLAGLEVAVAYTSPSRAGYPYGTYPNASRSAGYGVAVGAGRPEAAVAAIAKTAEWAAAGLARSGLGEWYACFIGTLDGVSRALTSVAPDRASQQLALQMYAPYLSEVAHRIPSFDPHRGGCGYRGQQRRGPNRSPRDDWDWNGANAPWSSDQERWDSYDDELDGPNNGWPFPIR